MNKYIYLFTRQDLSIPQQIIQTAHAVDEMNKLYSSDSDSANFMVLSGTENEISLIKIAKDLAMKGIEFHIFYEPDITSYSAIATIPLALDKRKKLQKYGLYKA